MKTFLSTFVLLFIFCFSHAQDKYMTRTGHISFFSKAPLENIEAHNRQVTSILNTQSGEMVFSLLMKGFEFEKALMQEHFNESYAESAKFPKSTFKGSIVDFDKLDMSKNGVHKVKVKGDLEFHGVSKVYEVEGTIEKKDDLIIANSKFPINVKEHGVKIPAGKVNNIAEVVETTVELKYEVYAK